MGKQNDISVVIPSFNGVNYIVDTLNSINEQTLQPAEVVISDDNSSDETVETIRQIANNFDFVTKLITGPGVGISSNYLNAVKEARGQIIIVADQDDPWMPGRVEAVSRVFESNPDVALVSTDSLIVDENLQGSGKTLRGGWRKSEKLSRLCEEDDFLEYLKGLRLDAHTLAFRKEVKDMLESPEFINRRDIWFEEKIAMASMSIGRLCYLSDSFTLYRQHKDQHTANAQENSGVGVKQCSRLERLQVLQALMSADAPHVFKTGGEKHRRAQLLQDYLYFLECRSSTSPKLSRLRLSSANLFVGRYSKLSRNGILSFLKDVVTILKA